MSVREVRLLIPGEPQPLGRPRFARIGEGVRAYASPKDRPGREAVISAWQEAGSPRFPDDAPILLTASFGFARPKGHYGTGKNAGVLKERFERAQKLSRPDLDNLLKLPLDALNKLMWRDDSAIIGVAGTKGFVERPYTHLIFQVQQVRLSERV